jgi:hypothetical protein
MSDADEVALNNLLADGIDPATAVVASMQDKPPAARKRVRVPSCIGAFNRLKLRTAAPNSPPRVE